MGKAPSQAASGNNAQPSVAAQWGDQPLGEGAGDVLGKTRQEPERKERGKAAGEEHDELPKAMGRPTVGRGFPPAVLRRARLRPRGGAGPQRTAVLTSPRGGAPRGFWERRGPHLLRAQGDGRDSPRGRRAPRGRGRSGAPREPGLRGREGREGARPGGPRGQPPAREAPHGRDGREAPPPASVPIRARQAFREARLPLEGQGRLVSQPGAVGRRRLRPGRGAPYVPHRHHRLAWPPRRLLTP